MGAQPAPRVSQRPRHGRVLLDGVGARRHSKCCLPRFIEYSAVLSFDAPAVGLDQWQALLFTKGAVGANRVLLLVGYKSTPGVNLAVGLIGIISYDWSLSLSGPHDLDGAGRLERQPDAQTHADPTLTACYGLQSVSATCPILQDTFRLES